MPEILDHTGKPIERQVLQEPQTSRLGSLHYEFADHPSKGLTPAKLASILEQAEQGDLLAQFDLFEDMEEKDGHIFTEMSKRKRSIMGLDWDIVPPRNATAEEKRATDLVKEMLEDIEEFDTMVFDIGDAIGKGFSALEYTWEFAEKTWMITGAEQRPQRWFMVPFNNRNSLRLRSGSPEGEELNPFGWLLHTHKARSGYITRAGLLRTLSWPYLFKNYALRDLAEFLEIYGLPLRLGTYPPGASDTEKSTLLQAVMSIGHHAAGIIPEGMKIDFQNAADGSNDPFEAMIGWCERTVSKAIIGATLTTEVGSTGGNRALGEVHQDVMHDIIVADAKQIQGTITRDLVYPLAALNVAGINHPSRSPRFRYDLDEGEDLQLYSRALPAFVNMGMKIPARYVHDKLKIPEAQKGEPVLENQKRQQQAPLDESTAAMRSETGRATVSELQSDRLDLETAPMMDDLIDAIAGILEESTSLEDFRQRLLDAWPDMDVTNLADTMRQALAVASLAGRYDILEEAGGGS